MFIELVRWEFLLSLWSLRKLSWRVTNNRLIDIAIWVQDHRLYGDTAAVLFVHILRQRRRYWLSLLLFLGLKLHFLKEVIRKDTLLPKEASPRLNPDTQMKPIRSHMQIILKLILFHVLCFSSICSRLSQGILLQQRWYLRLLRLPDRVLQIKLVNHVDLVHGQFLHNGYQCSLLTHL